MVISREELSKLKYGGREKIFCTVSRKYKNLVDCEVSHIRSRKDGGSDDIGNLILTATECNRKYHHINPYLARLTYQKIHNFNLNSLKIDELKFICQKKNQLLDKKNTKKNLIQKLHNIGFNYELWFIDYLLDCNFEILLKYCREAKICRIYKNKSTDIYENRFIIVKNILKKINLTNIKAIKWLENKQNVCNFFNFLDKIESR